MPVFLEGHIGDALRSIVASVCQRDKVPEFIWLEIPVFYNLPIIVYSTGAFLNIFLVEFCNRIIIFGGELVIFFMTEFYFALIPLFPSLLVKV